ncbi:MAG: dihydrodipicolinate synthase family protein [Arenicellales bacterium]
MKQHQFQGVWVPALTPFRSDLAPDTGAFVTHCRWVLGQGADGLAVFGTTSEANSLSITERMSLLEALVEAGVPGERLMPGVGCCAPPDTVSLCRHALEHGCAAVLMLPPFYYKNVGDDGLFAAFSWIVEEVASEDLRIFLYHIPPVTQVPISLTLVDRLLGAYPRQIAGLKDSGGDWQHTRRLLERFSGLRIFAGSERFLLDTLRSGGAGCITASGNVNPAGIRVVYDRWSDGVGDADDAQGSITAVRDVLEQFKMIPALKSLCARHYDDDAWRTVRPPLTALSDVERDVLYEGLNDLGFSMAGCTM